MTTELTATPAVLPYRAFDECGDTYVYAARTGALFRLERDAREVLSSLAPGATPAGGADPARAEILAELAEAGVVHRGDGAGPAPLRDAAVAGFEAATLVLVLTERCNLACSYCYEAAREGPCRGPSPARRRMSEETVARSIDFLLEHAGPRKKVTVVFFGGEPLLELPAIRAAVAHARARAAALGVEVAFTMTTNGTLLSAEAAGYLRGQGISVCVSVDGPPEVQDRNRRYASGKGSYGDVRRGVAHLVAQGGPAAARVTLARGAPDVEATFDHLVGLGFGEVGFAPASTAEGDDAALTPAELDAVLRGFARLADRYVEDVRERRVPAFSNLTQILGLIHRGTVLPYPCGAAIGMVAADPEGVLWPCHRLCGVADPMGDVASGVDEPSRRRFLEGAAGRCAGECAACWARPLCAGGCYHDAQLRAGRFGTPSTHHCTWIRELFLLGLRTYVRIERETPTYLDVVFGERGTA